MAEQGAFRGSKEIGEIADMIKGFANDLDRVGKKDAPIRLYPKHYDLIKRCPRAGGLYGFTYYDDGKICFGLREVLRGYGTGRYSDSSTEAPT